MFLVKVSTLIIGLIVSITSFVYFKNIHLDQKSTPIISSYDGGVEISNSGTEEDVSEKIKNIINEATEYGIEDLKAKRLKKTLKDSKEAEGLIQETGVILQNEMQELETFNTKAKKYKDLQQELKAKANEYEMSKNLLEMTQAKYKKEEETLIEEFKNWTDDKDLKDLEKKCIIKAKHLNKITKVLLEDLKFVAIKLNDIYTELMHEFKLEGKEEDEELKIVFSNLQEVFNFKTKKVATTFEGDPYSPTKSKKPIVTTWYNLFEGITIAESNEGVLLFEIKRGCPMEKAGMRRRDVIIKIDDIKINNIQNFRLISKKIRQNKAKVSILFKRNNRMITKTIKSSKKHYH